MYESKYKHKHAARREALFPEKVAHTLPDREYKAIEESFQRLSSSICDRPEVQQAQAARNQQFNQFLSGVSHVTNALRGV